MKRLNTYRLFWIAILTGIPLTSSFAQTLSDHSLSKTAGKCRERLTVFTDRSLYAVQEDIRFTARLQKNDYPYNAPESSVLYVELISPDGLPLAQGKYPVIDSESRGILPIPAHILSGTYYLRSYTRWMRNFGEADFAYLPLRVVNSFHTEVLQTKVPGSTGKLVALESEAEELRVNVSRNTYIAGEMVEVECSLRPGRDESIPFGCITVLPEGAIDTASLAHRVQGDPGPGDAFQLRFLPDLDGIALSGKVNWKDGRAAAGIRIHFSMLGPDPALFVARSDSQGLFIVKTPTRYGSHEMFVSPEASKDNAPEVQIDNDFSTAGLPFAPAFFSLNEKERSLGSRVSLHMQLRKAYSENQANLTPTGQDQISPYPFYGRPGVSVNLGEFVNLPNMEEVFENLVPGCNVKQHQGRKYISIESANPMISIYSPLILIDHIPVFDPEIALAISPSRIERIEVVPQVYILGDSRYGGIISIISLKRDMAGIRLPESSYFFDYLSYLPPAAFSEPEPEENGNIPDTRNTIYWSDHAEITSGESSSATFRSPSIPGNYLVLYRGISSGGELIQGLARFKTVTSTKFDTFDK